MGFIHLNTSKQTTLTTKLNMNSKMIVLLCALFSVALSAPQSSYSQPSYPDAPPAYQYDYAVKDDYSGVDFGQTESRDGYNTQGSYYVALPDGRLQKVSYTVTAEGGYVADVTYEGEAQYPDPKPSAYKPAPSYA